MEGNYMEPVKPIGLFEYLGAPARTARWAAREYERCAAEAPGYTGRERYRLMLAHRYEVIYRECQQRSPDATIFARDPPDVWATAIGAGAPANGAFTFGGDPSRGPSSARELRLRYYEDLLVALLDLVDDTSGLAQLVMNILVLEKHYGGKEKRRQRALDIVVQQLMKQGIPRNAISGARE